VRLCRRCGTEKPESEFWKATRGKDGLDWHCIPCRKTLSAGHRERRRRGEVKAGVGRPPRPVNPGHRWCCACKQELREERFTGIERTCRLCKHRRHLRRKYGLTVKAYEALLDRQGDLCACCGEREHRYVDHCHDTGRVRGLLCPACNTLAQAPETLRMVLNYVERHAAIARNE
jgi:hypothetical protein